MYKIAVILLGLIFGTNTVYPAIAAENLVTNKDDGVLIVEVEDISQISAADYQNGFSGNIFYQTNKMFPTESEGSFFNTLSQAYGINEVNVDGIVFGKYFYEVGEGILGEGIIMGTEYSGDSEIERLVASVKEEIQTGEIVRDYQNIRSRLLQSFSIEGGWEQVSHIKLNWSLSYKNVFYGNYAEWVERFVAEGQFYRYHAIVHEACICPNNVNTDDFRASQLIFEFSTDNKNVLVRDYQPKARTPEATISYGCNLGAEIGSQNTGVSFGISCSYSTISESPKIYDKGNMALDKICIDFEYQHPWSETKYYKDYNMNQSMQTAMYILAEDFNNTQNNVMTDKRTVQIVRDHIIDAFNRKVNFLCNYDFNINGN